jgi:rod shape determining protein RodA
MFAKVRVIIKNLDWFLLVSVLLLVCFGLAEMYSISYSQGASGSVIFKKQLLAAILSVAVMLALIFVDYYFFYSYSQYFYLLAAGLLLLVLFFGQVVNSTKGWFSLAGLSFQPVEFAKFALLLFLARYFADAPLSFQPVKRLLISGVSMAVLILLVLLQPDLGSAALLFAIWFGLIIALGFPKKYLAVIVVSLALLAVVSWQFLLADYQKERILTFISFGSTTTALSRDYNINQAVIAVGAGGWLGRGLGFGSQSQLKFLPEAKNDFIFAVISEELGFLGVALTLLFFSLIFYRLLASLKRVNNDFGIFFLLGAGILIFIEMFVNIAMNMGLLPVVGIGLPFLSYGGSAMLINLMIVGVAESIIVRAKIKNY